MREKQTIEKLLAEIGLPEGLVPITDEKPAFYDPSRHDGRFAYYLVAEGVKPEDLRDTLKSHFQAAGFKLDYSERRTFYYSRGSTDLTVDFDISPEGASQHADLEGHRFAGRTRKGIKERSTVVTFSLTHNEPFCS